MKRGLGVLILMLPTLSFAVTEDMSFQSIVYGGDTRQVFGFDAYIDDFEISNAGMYEATLTDFNFPVPFDYIGFMVTQGATERMGVIEGSGSFSFYAEPGTYYATFVGFVNESSFDASSHSYIGGYGVQVAMVPELETWIMMFLGLGAVIYWTRRRNHRPSNNAALVAA
ncbi:MAG: hypothetical protein OEZ43_17675 [Gammaproteobacteria bacterium]|nr:hypothetical protein [Gammaproteobacteria bacterium]